MASRGINKVILVGNLGNDPETKSTPSGSAVCNFSVATGEAWKDQQGVLQERTEWHRIVVWGKLADICGQYLRKGSKVYLEGRLQTRKWQDKDGQDKYTTEIVVNEMQMLDGKKDDGGFQPAPGQKPRENAAQRQASAQSKPVDFDDDIPF